MKVMIKKKWEQQKLVMFIQLLLCPVISIILIRIRDWNYMTAPRVFSVSIALLGMFICLILFMSVVKNRNDITLRTGSFSYLITICGLELFLSLAAWVVDEIPRFAQLNMIVNVASQALSSLMLCIAWQYLVCVADLESQKIINLTRLINIVALITFAASIGNYFGHYYFYVDASGLYIRGTFFLSSFLYSTVMFFVVVGMVLFMDVDNSKKRALLSFVTLPIIAAVIQTSTSDIDIIYPAFLCSLILIYGNVFAEQNHELTKHRLDVIAAENRLLLEQQKHERISAELNMATEIQTRLLPAIFPPFPEVAQIDLYSTMHPAKEVGGDFYDFFRLDEDHIGLVIADVSGKGVPAALYMMIAKTLIKTTMKQGLSPAETLFHVNQQFCDSAADLEMFVTVWLGCLELSTMTLTAANAGHEYPAIKRAGGKFELYKDKHSFVVGGMNGVRYKEYTLPLNPGDTLLVYTDGVTEACDEGSELFGTGRMLDALNKAPERESHDLIEGLYKEIQEYMGAEDQFDDITILALRIKEQLS